MYNHFADQKLFTLLKLYESNVTFSFFLPWDDKNKNKKQEINRGFRV